MTPYGRGACFVLAWSRRAGVVSRRALCCAGGAAHRVICCGFAPPVQRIPHDLPVRDRSATFPALVKSHDEVMTRQAASTTQDDRVQGGSRGVSVVLHLVCQHGKMIPDVVVFDTAELVAGRDAKCQIRLDSPLASRRHAQFRCEPVGVSALDLGSRNGLYVNAQRVEARLLLRPGDVLRIGSCVGVIASAEAPTSDWKLRDIGGGLMAGMEFVSSLESLRAVACSALPVSIVGATGSGKERVAGAIHNWSHRSGPLCPVNCAALPTSLAEAELFGYCRGAFTGALSSHQGYFRQANRGTLFLDEIAELGLDLQAKLLRVVEEKVVRPLGDDRSHPVDVRLLAASQVPLDDLVARGKFREDLARRVCGMSVELPPLRRRKTEIIPLFRHFVVQHLAQVPDLEPRLVEALLLHDWPGNVRQLDLLVRRLVLIYPNSATWGVDVLPSDIWPEAARQVGTSIQSLARYRAQRTDEARVQRDRELDQLRVALNTSAGNLSVAAAAVGISRQRAYRLLRKEAHSTEAVITARRSGRDHRRPDSDR